MAGARARIFVASSVEGKKYASAIARVLEEEGADPLVWWSPKSFPPNRTLIESLEEISSQADGALIVATPDDKTMRRGAELFAAASNVVLEYGLFVGDLGRSCVAIVCVGEPQLPTDLGGVVHLSLQPFGDDVDDATYRSLHVEPQISQWLQTLDVMSTSGRRLAGHVKRLMPRGSSLERARLKARILAEQIDPRRFARQPESELAEILARYTSDATSTEVVGFRQKTAIKGYIDLTDVDPGSDDERALAEHLCHHIARVIASGGMRPTVIALSKLARNSVTSRAAGSTPYPLLLVNPYGPNARSAVEGFCEDGDVAVLLHDVALSGSHLVDCVMTLRNNGIDARHIIALVKYGGDVLGLDGLMEANGIELHADSDHARIEAAPVVNRHRLHPSLTNDDDPPCILCDVLDGDDDTVPFRRLLSREEAPSEVLLETPTFSVIADVAPLQTGHVLIVTKEHTTAMGRLSREQLVELDVLRCDVSDVLSSGYGSAVIAFEHGLCSPTRRGGCGVDHAHLHVLPLDDSIRNLFSRRFEVQELSGLSDLGESIGEADEYVLLIDQDDIVHVAPSPIPSGQYFRRVIAEVSGEEMWNWMDYVLLRDDDVVRSRVLSVRSLFERWTAERSNQAVS